MSRPTVVLDVNETLTDLEPLRRAFTEIGAAGVLATTWFSATLRDGFALSLAGVAPPFLHVARASLLGLLAHEENLDGAVGDAADFVLDRFTALPLHEDVPAGVKALKEAGCRVVTLSNGGTAATEKLLQQADLVPEFDALLSVDDVGVWKPHPQAYAYAVSSCGVAASEMLLVAVHPWDIHGAAQAGLQTAYLNRTGTPWPRVFDQPDHRVRSLEELADVLA